MEHGVEDIWTPPPLTLPVWGTAGGTGTTKARPEQKTASNGLLEAIVIKGLTERTGFEPVEGCYPLTGLAIRRILKVAETHLKIACFPGFSPYDSDETRFQRRPKAGLV